MLIYLFICLLIMLLQTNFRTFTMRAAATSMRGCVAQLGHSWRHNACSVFPAHLLSISACVQIVNEGKAYAPASKGQLPVWLVTPRATAFARVREQHSAITTLSMLPVSNTTVA